jgi:diguanylate cyclase (GGDEF)-like protein/PAS domain S-box-containing protein
VSPQMARTRPGSRRRKLGIVLACAGVLAARWAPGAAPVQRFAHLSVEQGLSQSTVQAILQDHAGFLWLATEEGLDRYDGYGFAVFKHDPKHPGSLPNDRVTALHDDRHGQLWVGTDAGLSLFDRQTETFTSVASIHGRVTGIVEDPDGTLWVGVEGEGLFERNAGAGDFVLHQHDGSDPGSFASWVPSALLRDHGGRLWIGTKDAGLERLETTGAGRAARRRFVHYRHVAGDPGSLGHDEVWGLAEDARGRLWVASYGGGLSVLDPETGIFRHYQHRAGDSASLGTDFVTALLVDGAGTLWVGTDGAGVRQYDPATDGFRGLVHDTLDPASLSTDVVRALYEDRQGQLWVGTYLGGANMLRRPRHPFGYLTHDARDPSSLADGTVASFLQDRANQLWVGTGGGWLHRFDRSSGGFVRYRFSSGQPGALSLHEDGRGRIWIGTYRGGLVRFDPKSTRALPYVHHAGDGTSLSNDEVWAIAAGEDGKLWLATNAGLDRFDPDACIVTAHYDTPSPGGPKDSGTRALLLDRQGTLWVGSLGGLHRLPRGGDALVRVAPDDPGLSRDGILAIHQDQQGMLWLGTFGGGLRKLDPATEAMTSYKAFPSNVIYGIQAEASGRLWVSTNHGLSRFDPASGAVENFDLTNGLQNLQFHLGASLRTREGRLLFGSVDGLYDFDPEAIRPETYAPPVVLTALRVFNEPVRLPAALSSLKEVSLTHEDKVFSLEFAALDYTLPRRNEYAYRMEGFSDKWIKLGGARDVTFTNLDPGAYVFRVKASNSDGVWNEAGGTALRVVIRPPFWGTWWFRGLSAGLVTMVLLAVHRVRVRRLTADLAARMRNEGALRQAEEKYRSIFVNAMEGIFQCAPDGRLLTANPALARMLGFGSPEEVLAEAGDLRRRLAVEAEAIEDILRRLEAEGVVQGFECEVIGKDGRASWVSLSVRAVLDGAGTLLRYEGTAVDVTDKKRSEEEIRRTVSVLQSTLESTADGILVVNRSGRVVSFNQAVARLWRVPVDVLASRDERLFLDYAAEQLLHPGPFLTRVRELYSDPEADSFDALELKDGRTFERYSLPHRLDGRAVGRVWSFRDITERRRAEEKVEYQAYHDALTGLPNRLLLKDRLTQALAQMERYGAVLAVTFLDIDNFKSINDTLGHPVGDRLLQDVAERLQGCTRQSDTVARVGGDEFALIFPKLGSATDAAPMAEKVLRAFASPFLVDGHELDVTASLGVAIFPDDGDDPDVLLRNADAAMYRAKEMGRNNYQLCTPGMNARAIERMSMERGLRRALERGELVVHYQPLVSLATGRIVGTEALVRWRHPERGLVFPDAFIPVAEETRLIVPLGGWVLETACLQLRAWRDAGFGSLRMLVNLSMRQLQQADLAKVVGSALERAGVPAECLELEITESVAMHDVEWTKGVLRALRGMGVRISIDDFGTGQSSLSHLKHFPLSTLKIDRTFVRDIAIDPDNEAIVSAVIALAHILKLSVVAEGVESAEQLRFLRQAGCEEGQGYLFGKPLSVQDVQDALHSDLTKAWGSSPPLR